MVSEGDIHSNQSPQLHQVCLKLLALSISLDVAEDFWLVLRKHSNADICNLATSLFVEQTSQSHLYYLALCHSEIAPLCFHVISTEFCETGY